MKTKLAAAMALVVAGLAVGIGPAPFAAAQSSNCPSTADFSIPDSEPLLPRTLSGNSEEIGVEDVDSGDDEMLHVRLETANDKLEWTVFHLVDGECETFTQGDCDIGGSYPNTLDQQDEEQTCTLDDPNSGTKDYWVKAENDEADSLDYSIWVET